MIMMTKLRRMKRCKSSQSKRENSNCPHCLDNLGSNSKWWNNLRNSISRRSKKLPKKIFNLSRMYLMLILKPRNSKMESRMKLSSSIKLTQCLCLSQKMSLSYITSSLWAIWILSSSKYRRNPKKRLRSKKPRRMLSWLICSSCPIIKLSRLNKWRMKSTTTWKILRKKILNKWLKRTKAIWSFTEQEIRKLQQPSSNSL